MDVLGEKNICDEDIKYVLNLSYVEGIKYDSYSLDNSNETNILLGLLKSYNLDMAF